MSDTISPKILDRIRKLAALADAKSGATEAEASVAMEMMQDLLRKNGLSMAEIEASGGAVSDDGKRERATIKRSSMYKWQRELMACIAETNFCVHIIHEEFDPDTRRKAKRHQLVGRSINVIATQIMYDYLVTTMKRLVSEAGHAPGTHNEKDYHYWLEACGERLQDRLKQRAREAKRESERKAREAKAAASHPASAGGGTALVLATLYTNEEELNEDFIRGQEPGTTTRLRLEAEGRAKARDDKYQQLKAEGMDDEEAWYVASGYTLERAREIIAYWKKDAEEQAKRDAKNAKRKTNSSGPKYRYTERERREDAKRASSSFRAGASAGGNIGLDPQIDKKEEMKRIG